MGVETEIEKDELFSFSSCNYDSPGALWGYGDIFDVNDRIGAEIDKHLNEHMKTADVKIDEFKDTPGFEICEFVRGYHIRTSRNDFGDKHNY